MPKLFFSCLFIGLLLPHLSVSLHSVVEHARAIVSVPDDAIYVDEENSAIVWTGNWNVIASDDFWSGTVRVLESTNSSMEFRFEGTDIWLYGTDGQASIFIDDVSSPIVHSSTNVTANQQLLWAALGLPNTNHTVRIVGGDSVETNMRLDFFRLSGQLSPIGAPTLQTSTTVERSPRPLVIALIVGSAVAVLIIIFTSTLLYLRRRRMYIKSQPIPLLSGSGASTPNSTTKFTIDNDVPGRTPTSTASSMFERQQELYNWSLPSAMPKAPTRYSVAPSSSYVLPRQVTDSPPPGSLFYDPRQNNRRQSTVLSIPTTLETIDDDGPGSWAEFENQQARTGRNPR